MHEKLPDPVPASAIAEETEDSCTCSCKGTATDANPEGTASVSSDLYAAVHFDIGKPATE
ncbi:MAG: hypothetical protein IH621_17610 [Krumholzibacteria bacterium]|nr:hypothetical protein [Candidatus Krumholzibacteria bacterium]